MQGPRRIRHISAIAIVLATMTGCAGQVHRANDSVSPVATTTDLPQTSTVPSDRAPETFRVKACETVSGGGGKNVATLLRDVRVGKQDDYDRVTFEFGPDAKTKVSLDQLVVPKYTVDSPESVSAGPKGDNVVVAGTALLGVLFDGAYAHESDKPTRSYPGPSEIKPKDFEILAEAKQGEDSEGHVRWALGLNKQRCPQVSTLTNPPRLVVDLPH
ncbi:MAG: AMIN-like domain-containing (lipo)protein [Mycobacterium sp.]